MPPPYDAASHVTSVADVHEALLHCTDSSSDAEAVGSIAPKFSPNTLTDAPPVCAAFAGLTLLTAGAAQSEVTLRCGASQGAHRRNRPYRRS